jgi:RNA polymerase sigma-70 factor (ECF subfamily)
VADTDNTADTIDERALLERARAGDEAAFGDVVRLHYEYVFRLVLSVVRNETDARDVSQEVWIVIWKKLSTFRGDSKFTTWLHPIAVRKALDHLRGRKRWYGRFLPFLENDEGEPIAEPASDVDTRDDIEKAERNARFERALATLPPKHRAVLTLREVQGLSYEEIATALKCRPGTVMSRLFHARRQLARKLQEMPCD